MPFKSKKQWRAFYGGYIPGISKEKAREWAHETKTEFKDLPNRAPAEKGKPTLLSKKASKRHVLKKVPHKKLLEAFAHHTNLNTGQNVEQSISLERDRKKRMKKTAEVLIPHFIKLADAVFGDPTPRSTGDGMEIYAPGTPPSVAPAKARGSGTFTPPRPKKPGLPAKRQATNPRNNLRDSMAKGIG